MPTWERRTKKGITYFVFLLLLSARHVHTVSETSFRASEQKEQVGKTATKALPHFKIETNPDYVLAVGLGSSLPNTFFTRSEKLLDFVKKDLPIISSWWIPEHTDSELYYHHTNYMAILKSGIFYQLSFYEFVPPDDYTHDVPEEAHSHPRIITVEHYDGIADSDVSKSHYQKRTLTLCQKAHDSLDNSGTPISYNGCQEDTLAGLTIANFARFQVKTRYRAVAGLFIFSAFISFLTCLLSGYISVYTMMGEKYGEDYQPGGDYFKWTIALGCYSAAGLGANFLCYIYWHIKRNIFNNIFEPNKTQHGALVEVPPSLRQRLGDCCSSLSTILSGIWKAIPWTVGGLANFALTCIVYLNVRRALLILLNEQLGLNRTVTTAISVATVPFIFLANLFGRGSQTASLIKSPSKHFANDGDIKKLNQSINKTNELTLNLCGQARIKEHNVAKLIYALAQLFDAYNASMAAGNGFYKLCHEDLGLDSDNDAIVGTSFGLLAVFAVSALAFTAIPANVNFQRTYLWARRQLCADARIDSTSAHDRSSLRVSG